MAMLQEAIQRDKNFSEAYFRVALIHKTQRHYDKAISYYHQGLALNVDVKKQKAYFLELGEVYQFVGDYEKSLQFLNRYLDNEIMNKRNIELATHLKRNSVYALKNQKVISDFRPKVLSDTVNAFPMQYFPVLTADERNLIMQSRCPDLHKITDTDTHTSLIFEQLAGTTYLVLPMLGSPLIHSMRRASVPIEELSEAAATRLRQQLLHAMYGEPNVG
jgi:tetratricopeptide (TPR) repeat protein